MSLKKSVTAVILQNAFTFLAGFVNSVLSTRILGPEGKGVFAIYSSSAELFALFLGIGVPQALLFFSARDTFNRSQVFYTALLFLVANTAIFWLILMLSFEAGLGGFFLPHPFDGDIYQFTLIAYFSCLLGWYLFGSLLNGHKLFVETNLISVVNIGFTLLLYGAAFYLYTVNRAVVDASAFYWIQLISAILVLCLSIWVYWRKVLKSGAVGALFLSLSHTSSVLSYGLLYFVSNLMIFFSTKIDYWFVNYLVGPQDLGIYVLASNFGLLIILLPNAIGLVLSAYRASTDTVLVNHQTAMICRLSFSGSLLLSIVLWFFGDNLIHYLYGADFDRAAPVLSVLLIGIVPYCVFTVLRGYFAGAGKLNYLIKSSAIGLFLMLLLDLLLIAPFGIMGAAIASIVAYVCSAAMLIHTFCSQNNFAWNQLLFITRRDMNEIWNSVRLLSK